MFSKWKRPASVAPRSLEVDRKRARPVLDRDPNEGFAAFLQVGDYRLLEDVGKGSYGRVLRAVHRPTSRQVAVKGTQKLIQAGPRAMWTERSVLLLARESPFLIGAFECLQDEDRVYFAMEYAAGGNFLSLLRSNGPLNEDETRFYSAQIALGVHFLHRKDVLLRNLSLQNIVLMADGNAKLVDFAFCKLNMKAGDQTATFSGSHFFLVPEVMRGERYGHAVDWWALGVVVYALLLGRSPFEDSHSLPAGDRFFRVTGERVELPAQLPAAARKLLERLLETMSSLHFPSAHSLPSLQNPRKRLCSVEGGSFEHEIDGLVSHEFYHKKLDWAALESGHVRPPTVVIPPTDPNPFCFGFAPVTPFSYNHPDQTQFEGFEWTCPQ